MLYTIVLHQVMPSGVFFLTPESIFCLWKGGYGDLGGNNCCLCLLMLQCGKKMVPGTAGRKLDSRSNLWYPHFQSLCVLLASHFCCMDSENWKPDTLGNGKINLQNTLSIAHTFKVLFFFVCLICFHWVCEIFEVGEKGEKKNLLLSDTDGFVPSTFVQLLKKLADEKFL